MSEILVPPEDINHAAWEYGQNLRYFSDAYDIPAGLFSDADHIVFKAADPVDFSEKVRSLKPWAEEERVAFAQINWRFVAAAQMVVPLALWQYKYVDWVEVMEPKEDTESGDYIGLEYAEFYYSDVNYAEVLLRSRGISVQRCTDTSHDWRWLNIVINGQGQEFRLSDKKLVEIVEQELEDGTARLI